MHRTIWLLAFLITACDSPKEPPKEPGSTSGPKIVPESPPTGIGPMHDMYKNLEEVVSRYEKGESYKPWQLTEILRGIDNLLLAVDRAIKEEARDIVQARHSLGRKKQAKIIEERAIAWNEIRQIDEILKSKKIPPGFTDAELKDKRKDLLAQAEDAEKRLAEQNAVLKKDEDLLALEVVPPQDDTAYTREKETILALKKRAEALRSR